MNFRIFSESIEKNRETKDRLFRIKNICGRYSTVGNDPQFLSTLKPEDSPLVMLTTNLPEINLSDTFKLIKEFNNTANAGEIVYLIKKVNGSIYDKTYLIFDPHYLEEL